MRIVFLFLFLLSSVSGAWARSKTIVVMGDSLASGFGSTDKKFTPAECLHRAFNRDTVDLSKPGSKTDQILEKIDEVVSRKPSLVFVSSGGNDAMADIVFPGSYSSEQTLHEMAQMFDRLLSTGAKVVYLGLRPPYPGSERLPEISALAQTKGVMVVDGMDGFWGHTELMHDLIHPNDKGYEIMCQRILDTIGSRSVSGKVESDLEFPFGSLNFEL